MTRILTRPARLAAAAALCAFLALPAAASTIRPLDASAAPIHLRVQFEANPAREAVVSWTTTLEGTSHMLYVDTEPRGGDLEAYAQQFTSMHSAPYTLLPEEDEAGMHAWSHNVFLGGLRPETKYYMVAVSDGEASKERHFITAPASDRPFRVLFAGDSRVGDSRTDPGNNRRKVNALMRELLEKHEDIIALVHGADYTNRAYWSQLYFWLNDHYEKTTTAAGRLLPIIPSRGNHDLDVGFEEKFWWPNRANDYYYATALNSESVLITLNSTISRGGDQRDWLENQLQSLRGEKRWIAVQYHHPAWPSVRAFASGAAQQLSWVPLFEQYQIDLGLESHDHALKRTVPIYANEPNPDRGIVYIGDGGGGVNPRDPDPERWYLEVAENPHHVHMLHFAADKLHVQAIDIDRAVRDDFTLVQDRRNVAIAGE